MRNICVIVTIRALCFLMKSGRVLVKFWTRNLCKHLVFLRQVERYLKKIVTCHSFILHHDCWGVPFNTICMLASLSFSTIICKENRDQQEFVIYKKSRSPASIILSAPRYNNFQKRLHCWRPFPRLQSRVIISKISTRTPWIVRKKWWK